MSTKVKVKKLDQRAKMPTYGTEFSAGADLYARSDAPITVEAHKTVMVRT